MTTPLQEIISDSSGAIRHECSFSGKHPVMKEHFPGDPLVPAFLQLVRVREMVCAVLDTKPGQVRVKSVKFLAPLKPERPVALSMEKKTGNMVVFRLESDGQTISQGELSVA